MRDGMMRRHSGLVAAGALVGVLMTAVPAAALPPDGAGSDTPGTSSSVSPSTLEPCQTLSFTVSGFPAGETVYVKIDDGVGYGDTSVQGSGVVHMQAIPSSGTVNGSFALPCSITPGTHWLRYLATQYVDHNNPGAGTIGFTNRGNSTFTVVAAGSSSGTNAGNSGSAVGGTGTAAQSSGTGSSGGNASSGLGAAVPQSGAVVGSGAEQVGGQGGTLAIDPNAVQATTPAPSPSTSAAATPSSTPSVIPAASAGAAAEAAPASSVPWVGIVVAAVLVAAGAIGAWAVLRRRGSGLNE